MIAKGNPTAKEVLDYFINHLLDGNIAPSESAVMNTYSDDVARIGTPDAAARAIAYLVLGSPDFQLA